jgi:putative ABC transport system substrate-binding protein
MRRREFIAALAGFASAWPLTTQAQTKTPVVGELIVSPTDSVEAAFQQGLMDYGYAVGQNISLLRKDASGDLDRVNQLAADLVAAKVDILFGTGSQTTAALKRVTNTIPIVTMSTNPVGLGFVASLARPGGNITGMSLLGPEVAGKRFELLKSIIPNVKKVGIFWNPDDPAARFSLEETETAAKKLSVELHVAETREVADFNRAFSEATKEEVQALILLPAPFMSRNASRIAELALANRLPTFGFVKPEAAAGELLSFGANIPAAARRAAYFVDRILKGDSPSDLPVEQPTKFDLVINLKTAKALGLDIPPIVLARADEVIE